METLVYLYLAQDYENPEPKSLTLFASSTGCQPMLSNWAALGLSGIFCGVGLASLAGSAHAQAYSSDGLYPRSVYAFEDNAAAIGNDRVSSSGSSYLLPENSIYYASGLGYLIQPDSGSRYAYPCAYSQLDQQSAYVPIRPSYGSLSNGIRYGDSGESVRQLQDLLRATGYFSSPSTGYFGTATESAVTAFQQDYGLIVDGVAGGQTIAALRSFA